MTTMTLAERQKREAKVKEMLKKGMTVNEMARILDVSQQSMSKFLRRRDWTTEKGRKIKEPMSERALKRKAMGKSVVDRSGGDTHKG